MTGWGEGSMTGWGEGSMTGWKLEGISTEAREAAEEAAREQKLPLGEWLSRLILRASESRKTGPETSGKPGSD